MPPITVYSVDFKQGNLTPGVDSNGWGPMRVGVEGVGTTAADPQGLALSLTASGNPTSVGPCVAFNAGMLPLATRLVMEVEFDRPTAAPPAPPATGAPEPWAVALLVKEGDENAPSSEPFVAVTCQFRTPGVRLNTPQHLEGDQAAELITPLDYPAYSPVRFTLRHYFCGRRATAGYCSGLGWLSVGPPFKKEDQRIYSNEQLSPPSSTQSWIGALGVSMATLNGSGSISARLRTFSIATW